MDFDFSIFPHGIDRGYVDQPLFKTVRIAGDFILLPEIAVEIKGFDRWNMDDTLCSPDKCETEKDEA